MVVVPSGSFWMGSRDGEGYEDEQPRHKVTVSYRFAAGRFPVTFEEWDVCHQDNGTKHKPNDLKWGRARRPVINVSWDHITNEYLPWLNKRLGLSGVHAYRLLTEAEWEYCCRAGTETAYSFGDKITTEQANFDGRDSQGRYLKRTADVGSFPSNGWGMHDMHGTVWEWCRDVFHETYESAPGDGSAREDAGSGARLRRVIRGGSWLNISRDFDSATRGELEAGEHYHYLGFRVARTLNP
jgi:formylglycine-generating enzyme required for sulfatase activity